ncbi:DMT family transporter [Marinobacterium sediminicola]|uniref:Permease of the drug/metabolite transporter (DMT) superfamily n=1 Tax=Marinobacterium sediminicola TaxID=518898 RepID=A0ABY1S428_9GAMM|nr:DMT family transporter [Marinobacterium sediminicola]ULG70114.1 DMT family transporter [Marinobacterium sediminicola]SMR78389.1 Permease of the drug/metabolite transporter (DMT) superfamily [Marinobacterium sediminicola]
MSPQRRHLDFFAVSILLVLCLGWGFQQIAIKLAAADIAPTLQIGLRSAFAAIVLLLLMLRSEGLRMFSDGTLKAGLLAGLMFGIEFLFVGEGLVHTSASHMVVFLYTSPIFTALGMHFIHPDERLSRIQWSGIALAFAGVCIAFLGSGNSEGTSLLGDAYALAAGATWGLTTVVIRGSKLSEAPAVKTLFYQMAVAAVLLIGAAFLMGNGAMNWTPETTVNMAFQAVLIALASYLTWFWLLKRYLASRMATFVFITPLLGVVFGVLILDEVLTTNFVLGGTLVLAGIFLVSAKDLLNRRKARRVREALDS